jgi:Mitochondrial glycoprotein
VLQKEHNEEIHEGGTEMGQEVKDLLEVVNKNGWKIVEDAGCTTMHRNLDTMKIRVSFHCQDLVYEEEDHVNENEQEEEGDIPAEEEELGEPPGSLRFTATATSTTTGKTLIFQCTSEIGAARIDAVSVGDGEADIDKLHTEDADYNEYVGPAFAELDEKLKEEFQRYLELDVGIDSDMATFMNAYADYREQQQYVKFLEECQKVLE